MKLHHQLGGDLINSGITRLCLRFVCLLLTVIASAFCVDQPHAGHAFVRESQVDLNSLSFPVQADLNSSGQPTPVQSSSRGAASDISNVVADVVEQSDGQYSRYLIHIHGTSGVDQAIPVIAPRGGLQVEVRDMTGDKVMNDLVLRPALFQSSLGVLLNDGRDHFTAAIDATLPSSLDSGQHRASGAQQIQELAATRSSRYRSICSTDGRWSTAPQTESESLASFAPAISYGPDLANLSGRAPPTTGLTI